MNVYRIEVKVAATMYVKASSEVEAREKANGYDVSLVEFNENFPSIQVTDRAFDDPDLHDVSLSKAGTLYVGKMKTVTIAEEDV